MDVKLDSLIEKIKKEGIEEAQQKSDEMVKQAQQQASSIIDQAKKEATIVVENGKREVDQFQANAEADLQQAARNTELLLKEKINDLFNRVFKREVAGAMKPDFLKELILKIVNAWAKDSSAEIILNNKDKESLETLLFNGLKKQLKDSVTFKVSNDVSNGFRIGLKGEQVYYDFSDEAIAEALKSILNPKLKEILDK